MTLKKIVQILDSISPFETQASWDNSGLCVGDLSLEITEVYLSLDADRSLIESLPHGALLVVHHPPIFKGLKSLEASSYPNNFLTLAIEKKVAIVSMHTNYDLSHLNRYVCEEVLGYEVEEIEGHLCYFRVEKSLELFAKEVAQALEVPTIQMVTPTDGSIMIARAALCTGSGMDLAKQVEADCFLTGDIKYHDAKEAQENGLSLLDVRHYESELFFALSLQKELQKKGINGIIANSKNPFSTVKG